MGRSLCGRVFIEGSVYEDRERTVAQLGSSDTPMELSKKGKCRLREHRAGRPQNPQVRTFLLLPFALSLDYGSNPSWVESVAWMMRSGSKERRS